MRVLLIADTVGGVWTYAVELIRALEHQHVDVALATMGAPLNDGQRAEVSRLRNVEVYESSFKLEWMDNPWQDVYEAGHWLLDVEQLARPDVIHLNGYAHGLLPWRAPVLVVGHSCVLSWWQAVKGEAAPPSWEHYRRVVRRGVQAADMVAAPTIDMLAALDRHYGPLRCARVISNGREAKRFSSGATMRKEPFVLAAGRLWDEAKNINMLEQVAPRLPWPVYVAGNNKHPNGGSSGASIEHHVRPLGCLASSEVAAWLKRAAIYALPARYEPFGLSVLEAALAGCALVLGDITSLREVWGDAAVFVPPDDEGAFTQAIEHLIAQPEQREALATQARVRALNFTPSRMAAEYHQAYKELLALQATAQARQMLRTAWQPLGADLLESELVGWPQ